MKEIVDSSHLNESDGSDGHNIPTETAPKKGRRGFGGMDRERVREIAGKGGKAAHAKGTAHKWTREEASAAGKKGGVAPHVRRGRGPRTTEVSE